MKVILNGKDTEIGNLNLKELVLSKGLDPKSAIVEFNREIVKKDLWDKMKINEGDRIELLTIVCGG